MTRRATARDRGWRSSLRRFLAGRLDPQHHFCRHLTIGAALAAVGLAVFAVLLVGVVAKKPIVRWDEAVVRWAHTWQPPLAVRVAIVFTDLGAPGTLAVVASVVAIALRVRGSFGLFVAWMAAFAGAELLDQSLHLIVRRPRPAYAVIHLQWFTYSFPSGHSLVSLVGYVMLAFLAGRWSRRLAAHGALRYGAAAAMTGAVGVSRVYLGVHYPSDVLAGWAVGAAWVAICLTALGVARQRGATRPRAT